MNDRDILRQASDNSDDWSDETWAAWGRLADQTHGPQSAPALLAEVQRLRAEQDKRTAQYAEAVAALAEQVQRSGQRMREHNADREELERLRAELADRPSPAEVLRNAIAAVEDPEQRRATGSGMGWESACGVLYRLLRAAEAGESK